MLTVVVSIGMVVTQIEGRETITATEVAEDRRQ